MTNFNLSHIFYPDWRPTIWGDHGVCYIINRVNQTNAANHGGLRSKIYGLTTDVDIRVVQRLLDLGDSDSIRDQLPLVYSHLIVLGFAAPAGHVHNSGDSLETTFQDP